MTPIMWWGLIANDFLAKPATLASRWHHNFSLVPELQMEGSDIRQSLDIVAGIMISDIVAGYIYRYRVVE